MGTYNDDLNQIETTRTKMARFFKVALHCHSPLSKDWGNRTYADSTINDKSKFLCENGENKFVEEVQKKGPWDLFAITDHMKCEYAEKLINYAERAKNILVLPGMEVNIITSPALGSTRLHILVILPPSCTRETFATLLPGCEEEKKRMNTDSISPTNLREWIKSVQGLNGICIAAHIESSNGIRCCFRQTAKSVISLFPMEDQKQKEANKNIDGELRNLIFDAGFDAIEIRTPEDKHHYRWEEEGGDKRRISTVLGLDAHCIEDYGKDERATLVKMTKPGLEGLKNALKFPETRIRFKCDIKEPPSPRILGIDIMGGEQSFFTKLLCGFSENLTCVIGPRGSGKSTMVEALRYVFGYNRTLEELDINNNLSDRIRALQKANLTNSQIRIYYQRRDGKVHILEATYDPKQEYTTKVFDKDGKGVGVDDVEKSGEYPLRLYGWSEIETLGRDQQRQRGLIDRMIPELREAIERRQHVKEEMAKNREKIRGKTQGLKILLYKNQGDIYRYAEYKKDFDELNREQVKKSFEEIDVLEAKKNIYVTIRKNISSIDEKISELRPINLSEGIDKIISKGGATLEEWWQKEQIREREIIQTEQFIAGEIGIIQQRLKQLDLLLSKKQEEIETKLRDEQEQLRKSLSGEPTQKTIADLRSHAKQRLERVSSIRDEYIKSWRETLTLLSARRIIEDSLERAQNEITGIRAKMVDRVQNQLNRFMRANLEIKVDIRAGGDKTDFERKLDEFLKMPKYGIKRKIQMLAVNLYSPVTFGRLLLEKDWSKLEGKHSVISEDVQVTEQDIESLREAKGWVEHRQEADIDVLIEDGERLLKTLEIQEVPWDDQEAILLGGRPVDQLSPGQRSSAMLPLIALAENSPLVIDQPEDNLDNRLVGKVLVDILAELKEHRQIIVCTHNPNIVVSGDAEQVITLEAETDRRGKMDIAGSIDDGEIVERVIELMEGGREAFLMRRQRYGI